jgi:hypothetical protein
VEGGADGPEDQTLFVVFQRKRVTLFSAVADGRREESPAKVVRVGLEERRVQRRLLRLVLLLPLRRPRPCNISLVSDSVQGLRRPRS